MGAAMTENELAMEAFLNGQGSQPLSFGGGGYSAFPTPTFNPMTENESALAAYFNGQRGSPLSLSGDGYSTVPQQTSQLSGWDKLSNWAKENKDLLLAGAMEFNNYQKQEAANKAQNAINQVAAKWSGFNPSLLNMIKPIEVPNVGESIANTFTGGPELWRNLSKQYAGREKSWQEEVKKMKEQEALNAGLQGSK